MTMTPQQRNAAVDQALAARHQLSRLRRSPDFLKKYAANDPDALDAVSELNRRIAGGIEVASEDVAAVNARRMGIEHRPGPSPEAIQAHEQTVQALMNDPDFAKRLAAKDTAAVRQWHQLSLDRAALHGIDPKGAPVGQGTSQPEPAGEQPSPSAVGSVTSGGAAS